ncbi:MAG TPA: hypothetical protein VLD86_04940 [Ilumatobacteraceae bacterium]|nr:hypothetical protein [Ilumatobacteraceae bacterium]
MKHGQRVAGLAVLALSTATIGPAAAAAGPRQISGTAVFDAVACPRPPAGYEDFVDYPGLRLTGSLDGCWYTNVDSSKDNGPPSGFYSESGREVFVGRFEGRPTGVFTTAYKFESKWDPDVTTGAELRGRCQHPIVKGSGTGGFAGATGRLDFKDIVADGSYVYRGHITV